MGGVEISVLITEVSISKDERSIKSDQVLIGTRSGKMDGSTTGLSHVRPR